MKPNLENLMSSVYEASEKLSDAESARDSFLEPILQALGATGGDISRCSVNGGELYIERTGSCRGCRWDDDYRFPLHIFTCEDPLKAAADYVVAKKKAKENEDRRAKLATVKRLQKELREALR